ncbi:SDR family oxidoreductase [Sphingomonas sp. 1P06PA]|uniref:SDR family NAD(P)-dependent oxidoreductase n=1 Tax=Sphingomonas sp. 1P06PA TaxID=554121 RepID=UPI0039A5DFDA
MSIHILATGTSRGIGQAIADMLSDVADVRLVGHATAPAPDRIAADLSDPAAPSRLWDEALGRLDGRIDVLINNAGIFDAVPTETPEAEWLAAWQRTMAINLDAAALLCRRAVLHWRERGAAGRIVNIASRAAHRGDSPAHWHYAASKAGMVAMTKTIARAHAKDDILAFAVCPGFTMTGMADEYLASRGGDKLLADIPLGRVAMPDEVATAVRFLALEAPPSMTGGVIDINGASYVR